MPLGHHSVYLVVILIALAMGWGSLGHHFVYQMVIPLAMGWPPLSHHFVYLIVIALALGSRDSSVVRAPDS